MPISVKRRGCRKFRLCSQMQFVHVFVPNSYCMPPLLSSSLIPYHLLQTLPPFLCRLVILDPSLACHKLAPLPYVSESILANEISDELLNTQVSLQPPLSETFRQTKSPKEKSSFKSLRNRRLRQHHPQSVSLSQYHRHIR